MRQILAALVESICILKILSVMFNPFSLENKTIVISGAASGIARQCAISCSKMGAKLILLDLNEEGLKETMTMVDRQEEHYWVSVNLLEYDKVSEIIKKAVAKVGLINGLLNCAGISTTNLFKLTKPEELDKFFHVNVYTSYFLTQECTKMGNFSKEGGSIVLFSSVAGSFGEVGKATYGMTKAALLNLAKHLAVELSRKKIRVNSISPGAIETPINMNLPHMKDPEKRAALEAQHLLGLGKTDDIANACIYLLSDASRWVTGTNLFVDGGFTTR
jgi:NAD(P)-dependent dehydrogenase (short-subunit alcohol dehydrogenase family)